MVEQYFRNNYPELIFHRHNVFPTPFDAVYFKKWIVLVLPAANLIDDDELTLMRNKTEELYGTKRPNFEIGEIMTFNINDLSFFQSDIGITGPRYTTLDEPVSVYIFKGKSILENGYHRLSVKVINGETTIIGKVIDLDV